MESERGPTEDPTPAQRETKATRRAAKEIHGKKKSVPSNAIYKPPLLPLFTGSFGALSRCRV